MIQIRGTLKPGSVMQRVVHSMTMAVVLVHMVCGCCWHHAHAEDDGSHHATAELACSHEVRPHCECDMAGDQESEPCEGCEEGTCDFVRAEWGEGFQPSLERSCDAWPTPEAISPAGSVRFAAASAAAVPAAPGPIYLMHRALLL